jgi:hypothetical protein
MCWLVRGSRWLSLLQARVAILLCCPLYRERRIQLFENSSSGNACLGFQGTTKPCNPLIVRKLILACLHISVKIREGYRNGCGTHFSFSDCRAKQEFE